MAGLAHTLLHIHHAGAVVRQSNAHFLLGEDFDLSLAVHGNGAGGWFQQYLFPQREQPVALDVHRDDQTGAYGGQHSQRRLFTAAVALAQSYVHPLGIPGSQGVKTATDR